MPKKSSPHPILSALLGAAHAPAFASSDWPTDVVVTHGPRSRLPPFLVSGDLSDLALTQDEIPTPRKRELDAFV